MALTDTMIKNAPIIRAAFIIIFLALSAASIRLSYTVMGLNEKVVQPRCDTPPTTFERPLVPKIVHQFWKTKRLDERRAAWRGSVLKHFPAPEFEHRLWNDTELDDFVRTFYPKRYTTWLAYEFQIQRVDVARYMILHKLGGLYLDLDFEVFRNFWAHLPPDRPAIVESPFQYHKRIYFERYQNSLMSSPANHSFWEGLMDFLALRVDRGVFYSTGPAAIDAFVEKTKAEDRVTLLPCTHFNRMDHGMPGASRIHRETIGRASDRCKCDNDTTLFSKHWETSSYLNDTGTYRLFF